MSKSLIIAEKPSVAQDIVRALTPAAGKFDKHDDHFENERYVVTSAVGHLVEIKAPEEFDVKRGKWSFANLPVIPPRFDLAPIDKAKSRLNSIVRLIKRKDITELINACDAGREGELIFRLIVQYAGLTKGQLAKPVKRLWLQSMTPAAIREGFEQLRTDKQMLPLADAARCRSEADWLVGINGTRAMTAFNSRDGGFFLTTVGRVQTPTLSIVVEREEKIRKHVARDYWEVRATFDAQAGQYDGKWFDPKFKKDANGEGAPVDAAQAERRADRLWNERDAQAIADAVRAQPASVSEEAKPSSQSSPLLYDLTTLQREANSRFGFSAKTTLSLAQALYEKHKVLTYPRTDSRALPEDYVAVVKKTIGMIASEDLPGPLRALAAHARKALDEGYVKPNKRVFDNAKVSDHFAIVPTLQAPRSLSEIEAKLYDMVVKRFLAVFYPPAEFMLTTRISTVKNAGKEYNFQTNGKVLVKPGWLAVYGKEAQEDDANLVAVQPGELVRTEDVVVNALKTKPPARYTEATLLGAMEGAGKLIDDEELREAMQEKGLGTPATRSSIIEGLIYEKYIVRDGRELVPTAKAFQLMTLLRGLDVEDLTKPELTGNWEYQLAQMEHGRLKREAFMAEIAKMAERIVKKAKEYDRDTIPGDYATLKTPCPNCGGTVKENYRRYSCERCEFSITKIPGGRSFELSEVEQFLRDKKHRPARRLSLEGRLAVHRRAEAQLRRRDQELEARVRLRRRREGVARRRRAGRLLGARKPRQLPEVQGPRVRARHELRVRAHGGRERHLRLQERQDHPAATGRARADEQAAANRQDRPAGELRLQQDAPQVQGAPRLGREGRQGRLRVRAACGEGAGEKDDDGSEEKGDRELVDDCPKTPSASPPRGAQPSWERPGEG